MHAYNFNYGTTDHTINQQTKAELVKILDDQDSNHEFARADYRHYQKPRLVNLVVQVRNYLKEQHDAATAKVEADRLAQLAAEKQLCSIKQAHQQIGEAFQAYVDKAHETVTEFVAEISKPNAGVGSVMRWKGEALYHAEQTIRLFTGHTAFFLKQAEEQTKTTAEIQDIINTMAEQYLNDYLRPSLSNLYSTNPISNVEGAQELKAKGEQARVYKRLAEYYSQYILGTSDHRPKELFWCF